MKKNPLLGALPILAKMLGRRLGVQVVIGGSKAQTDGQTIHLPALPVDDAALAVLANGYIDHEAAHLRYTDFAAGKPPGMTGAFSNLLEDIRIEQALGAAYPGSRDNLAALVAVLEAEHPCMPPADAAIDRQVLAGLFALLRARVLGQTALAPAAATLEARLEHQLPEGVVTKLLALAFEVRHAASTTEVIALAQRIVAMLAEEAQAPPPPAPTGNGADAASPGSGASATAAGDDHGAPSPGSSSASTGGGNDASSSESSSASTGNGADAAPPGSGSGSSSTPTRDSAKTAAPAPGAGSSATATEEDRGAPPSGSSSASARNGAETASLGSGSASSSASAGDGAGTGGRRHAALRALLAADGGSAPDLGEQTRVCLNQRAETSSLACVTMAENDPPPPLGVAGDSMRAAARTATAALRRRLGVLIQAQQQETAWCSRQGQRLATARLYQTALPHPALFARRDWRETPDTAVALLLDRSSSMHDRIALAGQAVLATALALDTLPGVV
ncbi:MAG: hypothetical protein R3F44_19830, partial [Candidatus Competibacteraceae bacterium]